jgi:SAM-dependent methyltransferase
MMTDQYADSAEFIEIMSRDAWQALGPVLTDALRRAGAGGPVIDVGAGSGLATMVAATTLPGADIVAVEPSPALRAVLLAKLVADPSVAGRVTVLDSDVQHAILPPRFGTVVAMNMIGHLNRDERRAFWALCAKRLIPGGQMLLNLQPPDRAEPVPDNTFCTIVIGRRTYEGSGWAEPRGADALTWHMRYRVREGDAVVADRAVDYHWWVVSEQSLGDELRDHGLTLRPEGPAGMGMYAITR